MDKFNLTPLRLNKVADMLAAQHTITSIAAHFGVHADVMGIKLREAGIVPAEVRNVARVNMRSNMIADIAGIMDDDKRVAATQRYLDRYPVVEDDDEVVGSDGSVDVITQKILLELELKDGD